MIPRRHALRLTSSLALALALAGCSKRDPASTGAPGEPPKPAEVAAASAPPDAVVKKYLELGATGDLSQVKELVDPKCAATKIGDVDAVKMFGARMTLSETSTSVVSSTDDTAKVKYTVKGSIEARQGQTETDIFGKKTTITVGSMSAKGLSQSSTLELVKLDGRWVVTCR